MKEGETIEVIVAHDANRFQFVAIFEKNVGASNIVLPKQELGKLPRGRAVIAIRVAGADLRARVSRSVRERLSGYDGAGGVRAVETVRRCSFQCTCGVVRRAR